MRLEEIEKELAEIKELMVPLARRQIALSREREQILANQWIAANKVTKADVQMSSGPGIPLSMTSKYFADWLQTQDITKRFVEWNTVIYFMTDFLQGYQPSMPATINDLPQ